MAEHGADAGVRLVEVDVDTTAYEQGHIPGAVGFNWPTELSDQIRRDIPTKADWEALLGRSGVGADTRIVFYGDNNNWFAAFAYWVARMYGHQNVALMNGGRKKWELEGRELTTDAPQSSPPRLPAQATRTGACGPTATRCKDFVAPRPGRWWTCARPAEFTGEILAPPGLPETAQRGGHIPGASNIPWGQAANDDGTFKSRAELPALYGGKGVTADKEVIAYCRIGERSSHTWFVLKELLGFPNVRNYDGSWTEWGSVIGAPIDNPSAAR